MFSRVIVICTCAAAAVATAIMTTSGEEFRRHFAQGQCLELQLHGANLSWTCPSSQGPPEPVRLNLPDTIDAQGLLADLNAAFAGACVQDDIQIKQRELLNLIDQVNEAQQLKDICLAESDQIWSKQRTAGKTPGTSGRHRRIRWPLDVFRTARCNKLNLKLDLVKKKLIEARQKGTICVCPGKQSYVILNSGCDLITLQVKLPHVTQQMQSACGKYRRIQNGRNISQVHEDEARSAITALNECILFSQMLSLLNTDTIIPLEADSDHVTEQMK